ncbi:LysR family transcriptional regulator [Photobacterium sp. TY1-4]|uniref:LysR family transcriptional regulator n=1 Tax=Photobacterium sp. TY1-4 TaxID=2899122 RepID=UPI0021C1EF58|nr:LysR family transcriptional regulator [Photobacterium sp. TY1-4]UXI04489.1 LysR substrate-binding domain-containing protein [Photobacterium sp. TY1-4]
MELLNDMALFVEVCKVMNFRRAAESLEMPSSTLSRRISKLEKEIGLRLLHRTTRKVELTEAGQIYYERCKRIVDEARLAHEQLGEMLAQPSGGLRVSVPVDFATIFLAPVLVDFASAYPGINFELDMTPKHADLVSDHVDVAIRMGEPSDSTLIARKLMQFQSQLFAAPGYMARAGELDHPSQLVNHSCIDFPKSEGWRLQKADEVVEVKVGGRFMLNNVGMMKRLAALEQGIIQIPAPAIVEELAQQLLVPVLPGWFAKPLPVYALTETRLLPAKVRVFLDFLRDRLDSVG